MLHTTPRVFAKETATKTAKDAATKHADKQSFVGWAKERIAYICLVA
jgi:hypothetical protein